MCARCDHLLNLPVEVKDIVCVVDFAHVVQDDISTVPADRRVSDVSRVYEQLQAPIMWSKASMDNIDLDVLSRGLVLRVWA